MNQQTTKTTIADLNTNERPDWCPGCGLFGIQNALKQALIKIDADPAQTVIVGGIGCGGQVPQWINTYGFDTLHGRALPVASAIKLCNDKLNVVVFGGDGDGYGIGMGHFIHAMRRNLNIVYIVNNNMVYGLTKGQTSPTSEKGYKSKSTPFGVIEPPVNPIALALTSDCTFIARGNAADITHLTDLIVQGLNHKGFALIDTLQACITFNKINTYKYFQERVYKLEDIGHDPTDKHEAFKRANEWPTHGTSKIPIGVFYKENRLTYEDELPQLAEQPLVHQDISKIDINPLLDKFT